MLRSARLLWRNPAGYVGGPKLCVVCLIFLLLAFAPKGFVNANFKATINGRLFGNLPMMTMKVGERVRWYLVSIGDFGNMHTPHWHGNAVLQDKKRTDVVFLSAATMLTVDMVPDNPGIWMFHCHISEHLAAGMHTHYQVVP